ESAAADFADDRRFHVQLDAHVEEQPGGFAVFGQVAKSEGNGVARGVDQDAFTVEEDFAGLAGFRPEDGAGKLAAPGADQPGKAEDFARVQRKAVDGGFAG